MKRFTWDNKQILSSLGVLFGAEHKNLEIFLKKNTRNALQDKGYQYVKASDNPQFLVSFVAGAMEEAQESHHNYRTDLDVTVSWSQTNEYLQGGISVVFMDLTGEDIFWQGTATQRLKNSQMRKQDGSVILGLIDIIMESLPPAGT